MLVLSIQKVVGALPHLCLHKKSVFFAELVDFMEKKMYSFYSIYHGQMA